MCDWSDLAQIWAGWPMTFRLLSPRSCVSSGMDWLKKLLGSKSSASPVEWSEVRFWALLHESGGDEGRLQKLLRSESIETVSAFARIFDQKLVELNRWSIWGAGYVIAGGMSDDSFHYFRSWILGKGKECYQVALSNPDSLGKFVEDPEECDNEGLEYVAVGILRDHGANDPRTGGADGEPIGTPWEEDDLESLFPTLWKQFGEE